MSLSDIIRICAFYPKALDHSVPTDSQRISKGVLEHNSLPLILARLGPPASANMASDKKIRILIVNPNSSHEMTKGMETAISSLPLPVWLQTCFIKQ